MTLSGENNISTSLFQALSVFLFIADGELTAWSHVVISKL